MEEKKKEALSVGAYVFIVLAALTIGEFAIAAVGAPWWSVLIGIALLKAWFVIQNYMHLPRLFRQGEDT